VVLFGKKKLTQLGLITSTTQDISSSKNRLFGSALPVQTFPSFPVPCVSVYES
jgi:hypothetical protein